MNLNQNNQKIISAIESYVEGGADYVDAILTYCEKHDLEVEVIAQIVKKSSVFKQKLRDEVVSKNLVKDDDSDKTAKFENSDK